MVFRPPSNSPAVLDEIKSNGPLQKELLLILKEIKIITEKLKQEEHFKGFFTIRNEEIDTKSFPSVIDNLY